MGRKSKQDTVETTSLRRDKVGQVPAFVADQDHLTESRKRELDTFWWYDPDDDSSEDDSGAYNGYTVRLYRNAVKEAFNNQRLIQDGHGDEISNVGHEDMIGNCAYHQSGITAWLLYSLPRVEELPVRFGCWCTDEEEPDERHASSATHLHLRQKDRDIAKYPWFAERLKAIRNYKDPQAYYSYMRLSGDSSLNPYALAKSEWYARRKNEMLRSLMAELAKVKQADRRPHIPKLPKNDNEKVKVMTTNQFANLSRKR